MQRDARSLNPFSELTISAAAAPLRRPAFLLRLRKTQNPVHNVGGVEFGAEVEMAVDVRRRAAGKPAAVV